MLADVDLKTGHVEIGQAGHPHPVIQRAGGDIVQESPGGFPVGLMLGVTFSRFSIQLEAGDRLIILSDGVTECACDNGEILGEEGLTALLSDLRAVSGPAFFETFVWRLADTTGNADFDDDVSGVMFEFKPDV
jgi:sigma-B regulation protein RsbU (phosphoserine phosphatase)